MVDLESHWLTAEVPAIVTRDEWDAAQSAIKMRLRSHGRVVGSDDDPYELRGRIQCGHCGRPLSCNVSNRHRYYTCQRHKPAIAAEQRVAGLRLRSGPRGGARAARLGGLLPRRPATQGSCHLLPTGRSALRGTDASDRRSGAGYLESPTEDPQLRRPACGRAPWLGTVTVAPRASQRVRRWRSPA